MSDYYAILGISHAAQADDIAKAYRRAALTFNPDIKRPGGDDVDPGTDDMTIDEKRRRFKLVSQAYVVLSDQKARAVYDAYGDNGVRHGGTGGVGIPGGLDIDKTDPDQVFRKFFGVDSPFQVLGNISGNDNTQHQFYSQSAAQNKNPPPAPPVHATLEVTLEDIHQGATRRVEWTNSHTNKMGNSTESPASFEFPVPKGVADGAVLTLKGKGNTKDGCVQGDVLVTVKTQAHPSFVRNGDDLHVTAPISLADALCGVTVTVSTIEGRTLNLLIDEVVHPKFQKVLPGEGLAVAGTGNKRGRLVVECATNFPAYLTAEQKAELRRILEQ